MRGRVEAVLFDLDGTVVDSAPDLAGAANDLRRLHGLPPIEFHRLRPLVGTGARGMLGEAFGLAPGQAGYEAMRQRFLDIYADRLLQQSQVFPSMWSVLDALERSGLPWGIVTNKAIRLARPLVDGLSLGERTAVLIGGDSTPFTKPHPEPLFEAARRLGIAPERCVYVGDDMRDVQSGRAAGMATLVASWGYLGREAPIGEWGADDVLEAPDDLLAWLFPA